MVTHVPRAPRVAIEAPMLIRRVGDADWRRATTINISRTGILLRCDGLQLDADTPVEITVTLPAVGNLVVNRILARGTVVRLGSSHTAGSGPIMAAQLDDSRVLAETSELPDASLPS